MIDLDFIIVYFYKDVEHDFYNSSIATFETKEIQTGI
jgi:hypothetical protein